MSEPKLIIEYFRECYETKVPGGLRITFDHEVKAPIPMNFSPNTAFTGPTIPAS